MGATPNLLAETLTTLVLAVAGAVLLVLTRTTVDKLILPKSPLSKEVAVDKNPAAGAVAAASFIAVAIIYSVAVS